MKTGTRYASVALVAGLVGLVAIGCVGGGKSAPQTRSVQDGGEFPGLPNLDNQAQGLLSYSVPCYVAQGGANIVAASGCTITVQSGGSLALSGGSIALSSGSAIQGHTIYGTATAATVVTGTALAPGAAKQPISIATAGTVPLTIPSAGVDVCIWNTGSQAVTIADTGNQVLGGNFAMGQYDVLCGFSDGTRFIERSRSNN